MSEITSEMLAKWKAEAEQASKAIERDGYADYGVDPAEVMALIAEVERLRAERQWQPMETAPRDGAPILLWNGYGTLIGYWGCRSQCWLGSASCDNPKLKEVTHWMPLPKPPEQKA